MASATGIPSIVPGPGEDEPLLGRPGDVRQEEGKGLYINLVQGL